MSRRFGKDGLSEYLCMYMPTVVSSGSSVRILYPRESYDSWEDLEGSIRQSVRVPHGSSVMILYHRESYDSWADPECLVRMVCQSTTYVVVDAPNSFYCHI
jgi:hypothetical protein